MSVNGLAQAVEASNFVTAFHGYGVSTADIARVVRIDVDTVCAWKTDGPKPGEDAYIQLVGLREIVLMLSDSLTPRGVGQWLHAKNRLLDGKRPLDALGEGQQQKVWEAGRALVAGFYI
ncbi:antitoxin Xre/MbcA/ParS toxin-binding domain-containing protein [Arthrobacter sp. CAN_C5]|uniref:antitoxin Xre/MbcA/ParS toxin-binding domain-containing protein n=1 Tax=Arthrobacter sp. CAN_C5 TaxID=2760706 RepID=UPI001AE257E4|nr:antitoxin Xre/MbcA/ParS toxin-binding domain-containing protein [Arthrobacter sp. CAN_C5]MBP2216044.1 hypothetical protein [Arthrobacter sp. CAN_C5]